MRARPIRVSRITAAITMLAATGALTASHQAGAVVPAGCLDQPSAGAPDLRCEAASGLLGATGVAVAPDGRRIFVAATGSSALATFDHGAGGSLRSVGCVSDNGGDGFDGTDGRCADGHALRGAKAVAVSPDGRHLYVAATRSGAVDTFSLSGDVPTQVGCLKESRIDSVCDEGRGLAGARSVAVSPDGRHVYVAAAGADAVTALARDPLTGRLSTIGCVSADGSDGACVDGRGLRRPTAVAVSPNGRWVHAAAAGSGAITTFGRSSLSGQLTQTGCVMADPPGREACRRAAPLSGAYAVTVGADGREVYAAGRTAGAVSVLRLRASTGELEMVGCAVGRHRRRGGCAFAQGLGRPAALGLVESSRSLLVASAGGTLAVLRRRVSARPLIGLGCLAATRSRRSPCRRAPALAGAAGVAVAPDGRRAYVAAADANGLQSLDLGGGE